MRTRSIPQYPLDILVHPAVFAGLGLLLLNDHVLRRFWPSPVTGKLGDFACMFFMPLIAAALVALLMPARPRLAGLIGFGLVGGLFAAGKTIVPVHAVVVTAAGALFGARSGWVLDATDLAALLAMLVAWRLWDRVGLRTTTLAPARSAGEDAKRRESRESARRKADFAFGASPADRAFRVFRAVSRRFVVQTVPRWRNLAPRGAFSFLLAKGSRVGASPLPPGEGQGEGCSLPLTSAARAFRTALSVVCLALAALLTMADSPAPDPGICCLSSDEGGIHATSGYGDYLSKDGGLTWERTGGAPGVERGENLSGKPGVATDPNQPQVQYRFAPGQPIERSGDGGHTWQVERQVNESDAAMTYYRLGRSSYPTAGPLDGLVDARTGNAVFAMSQAGVLVRTPAGEWRRAAVGDYRPFEVNPNGVLTLVYGETLLAAGLALLSAATLALLSGRPRWRKVLVIVCWLAWLTAAFVGPDLFASGGYGVMMGQTGTFAVLLLLLPVAAHGVYRLGVAATPVLLRGVAVSLAAGLLFLLPYVLWAIGTVPRSLAITILACVLGAGIIAAGYFWLRQRVPAAADPSGQEMVSAPTP